MFNFTTWKIASFLTITASVCLQQAEFNGLTDYILVITAAFVTALAVHSTFSEIQNTDGRTDIHELHIIHSRVDKFPV